MKILLITSVLPWPLRRNGGGQRTELLRRALQCHGEVNIFAVGAKDLFEPGINQHTAKIEANVLGIKHCAIFSDDLCLPSFWYLGPIAKVKQTIFRYVAQYLPDSAVVSQFDRVIREHGPYDLIVSRYLSPAMKVGLSRITNVPKILDFDDVDWGTFQSSVKHKPWTGLRGRLTQRLVQSSIKRTCIKALDSFDAIWVTSDEDQREVPKITRVLPNISFEMNISEEKSLEISGGEKIILFVGDLQFPPNIDGLDRFLRSVWPSIIARVGDAKFMIIGRGLDMEKGRQWSSNPGVTVLGFVDDLGKAYASAAFTVVPVYFGGGTKIKVLESLMYRRTTVLPAQASRGYSVLLGKEPSIACVDSDESYADTCVMLLEDPKLCAEMAVRGSVMLRQLFSFENFSGVVAETIADVSQVN